MAGPEFSWLSYDVPLSESVLPRVRGLIVARPTKTTATMRLPDLSAWPAAADKANILLQSAAEVEHALMVQYLYATYSLKSASEVTDAAQKKLLDDDDPSEQSWPRTLLGIAREEMGHLMTVQNLRIALGLEPIFDRDQFPINKEGYPFPLRLEPLSQSSLAKYVVAESPADATGIERIIELATAAAGSAVDHVGVLYGLLGLVFNRADQVEQGATADQSWNEIIRVIARAAYQQSPEGWHLTDDQFHPNHRQHQADPADWTVGQLRVHPVSDRASAIDALRDITEQGEGPLSGGQTSHFERFLRIFSGTGGQSGYPGPGGWIPTRDVPVDPKITDTRAHGFAQLADARYALLLGFVAHYLSVSNELRQLLVGWIFAEMRSRLGFLARELTAMPRGGPGSARAAALFTLPKPLQLPDDETARWQLHSQRTQTAIDITQRLRGTTDPLDGFLADLLASDQARLEIMKTNAALPIRLSFARDIRPLFRQKDIEHMAHLQIDLNIFDSVKDNADIIVAKLSAAKREMPPPPDVRWTATQLKLLQQWVNQGFLP